MIDTTLQLKDSLDAAFKPESIAIIGASNGTGLGGAEVRLLKESNYQGDIYPINPKEDEIQGLKAYASVLDVPYQVDRASIIVQAKIVPKVIKECAEKGVKVAQIYSAGFSEMDESGGKLEKQMMEVAAQYNMRIIGPNCIGTYCPTSGINFTKGASTQTGNIAFVSQSGGIAFDMVNRGNTSGIHFSKVISIGNCLDLDHSDFLEYLEEDEETEIIALYVESVKDGKKFMNALKRIASKKQVVVLKGGRTASGSKSVASHTGNIAGDFQIWEALFHQSGTYSVKSIDELIHTLLSLQYLYKHEGKTAIVGNGGGATVLATDYCDEKNIELAMVNESTKATLTDLGVAEQGRNINPIDMPAPQLVENEGQLFGSVIKALYEDKGIGYILFHFNLIPIMNYMDLESVVQKMIDELDAIDLNKVNLIAVLRYNGEPEVETVRYRAAKMLQNRGIPVFNTIENGLSGIQTIDSNKKLGVEVNG